jgi:hypothetical protein
MIAIKTHRCNDYLSWLPMFFSKQIIDAHRGPVDVCIHFVMLAAREESVTVATEQPGKPTTIFVGVAAGPNFVENLGHEFAHVLQILRGDHLTMTVQELEEQANVYQEVFKRDWKEVEAQSSASRL